LITRHEKGNPQTVRYEAVNAVLLNEFLKEHRAFLEERCKVERLEKQVAALTAGLQKVSAQLEMNNPAPQVARNTVRCSGPRVYDDAGNVIETQEHRGDFKEW